jgi:hypothetical protein
MGLAPWERTSACGGVERIAQRCAVLPLRTALVARFATRIEPVHDSDGARRTSARSRGVCLGSGGRIFVVAVSSTGWHGTPEAASPCCRGRASRPKRPVAACPACPCHGASPLARGSAASVLSFAVLSGALLVLVGPIRRSGVGPSGDDARPGDPEIGGRSFRR